MSVVGIDFGDESCYVAVARAGGIETVDNDYSLRATPSFVAFGGKQRILGVAAKNQHITNLKNTVYGFKRLIGRKINDVSLDLKNKFPFELCETKGGGIEVQVNYLGEDQVFSVEQVTAMLFSKLKETTETAIQASINDCVISCPSFFTNTERQALLDAAMMSGFNVLRLFNDTTATALSYGIYKQDLPAEDDPPRYVIFVDGGHSALQVFACAFNKGKLKMLSTAYDATLGGKDFTAVIATHFCEEFKVKYGIDPQKNHRAYVRLLAEVEKLKKQMSANSTKLPFGIECLMEDKDVSSYLTRAEYEAMAAPLFERVEKCLTKCFNDSGLKLEDIYAVEIVGGASRTPAMKALIEKVFGKTSSTTLNQDEAVARGCALMCAIISPAFKVKEFSITDVQQHPIKVIFDEAANEKGEMEVFPQYHPIPFSKMLTFHRRESFTLKAEYSSDDPTVAREIGTYTISNVKATPEENIKIKIKTKVNLHGIFSFLSASAYEKDDTKDEVTEPMESSNGNPASPAPQPMSQEDQEATSGSQESKIEEPSQESKLEEPSHESKVEEPSQESKMEEPSQESKTESKESSSQSQDYVKDENQDSQGEKEKKSVKPKKQKYKVVDLPIEVQTKGFSRAELTNMIEVEGQLVAQDRREKERIDVKNALEEYVYDLRDKLEGELREFVTESERAGSIDMLNKQEEWLYEDGSDEKKSVYIQRLEDLKKVGDPVKNRKREFDELPGAIENLSVAISRARKVIDAVKNRDPNYEHLEAKEVAKLSEEVDSTSAWLDSVWGKVQNAKKDCEPPIQLNEIFERKDTFQTVTSPIINKSKPKVEPPQEEQPEAKEEKEAKSPNSKGRKEKSPTPASPDKNGPNMDLDVD